MGFSKDYIYKCEVWSLSTNLASLKLWVFLLPLSFSCTGLSTRLKRFTLLRSPLGNKTAKDQFERREYRGYFCIESKKASKILALISVLRHLNGVKYKVKMCSKLKYLN
uniref:ribosomal protein S10 n=1 Tax=Halosiphon tomentosus TaxID=64927 RepID=UPI002E773101|nr:ribosomal protein S10 [Halosiphon tomentosus]WBP70145.1 ribosomal protein S10 [Halosiphon tomentosus]